MARRLYELVGEDPARRFSPFCWRSRMALAHKGLEAECVPWRFTEAAALAFSGQDKVPVLVDGDRVVSDSWAIAAYLEAAYPERPALFAGRDPAAARLSAAWADAALLPLLGRLIISDILPWLGEGQRDYFRASREARFGMTLEQITADREERVGAFRAALAPMRLVLKGQPFLGGAAPDYADYAVFGNFQWARCVSAFPLLEAEDIVAAWRERMLDLFGGLARDVPHCG
ncbi:glutathione S-transferase family protein [Pseudoroseomonas cervicalis]|uniref:Glutathione S-transferase, N-terminal domain protein n=1 Tax=Pseudoroseomonas cervicalis ATCC 49957 TaxID=525371 RepID=D5RRB7_9PROT|nr:glutathione S-transferase family protein [Pseudoroseomonas cervicalis]EFH10151.1 glutathione S-transferase, N-terminal domain protein [Pseudoroseomonas cervicalis ATCC 49957]